MSDQAMLLQTLEWAVQTLVQVDLVAEQWAEHRRQHEEEERRQRVMVITEFDAGDLEATMHAMATEILRYRHCVRQLADAVELTRAGAEFGLIRPGPSWRPKRTPRRPTACRGGDHARM